MNPNELFRDIGNIDDKLIEEAQTYKVNNRTLEGRCQYHDYGKKSMHLCRKVSMIIAAAVLAVFLVATVYPGEMTALASRISNYISGLIKTRTDSLDLGSAQSLNVGRVEGLDQELSKEYTSYQALEKDLGLDFLEYNRPYRLGLGDNYRPIHLQYFDYNESASISVCIITTDESENPMQFSYSMDYLTGSNGRLGNFTFDGDDIKLESYTHPTLNIPVAVVKMSNGMGSACFIYNNVRYTFMPVKDIDTIKGIIENME